MSTLGSVTDPNGALHTGPTSTTNGAVAAAAQRRARPTWIAPLQQSIKGTPIQLILPEDEDYLESIKRWSDYCEKPAGAIAKPTSAEDVSKLIKLITFHHIPFAVKGGGHGTSGASSTNGGLVIDLSGMRNVKVDPEAKTVSAEGGCIWKDVDEAAGKHGLACVGGTVNHTGIGGLSLGGGYGFLTPEHGLVVDNILSVTIVTADGRIKTASETENADLFWAIRGAGQNFGVVTEFVFRAHEQKNTVWGGLLLCTADKLADFVKFANDFHEKADPKACFMFGFTCPPPLGGGPAILSGVFYNGTKKQFEEAFAPILALGPIMNGTKEWKYVEVNGMLNDMSGFGGRKMFGGTNIHFPVETQTLQEVLDDFVQTVNQFGPDKGLGESAVVFELFPNGKINERSNHEMAFCGRGDLMQVGLLFKWNDPKLDTAMRNVNREFAKRTGAKVGVQKSEAVEGYANYISHELTDDEAFGNNARRLRELKNKYDPANIFNQWHKLILSPVTD